MPVIPATPWTANSTVPYADQSYQNGTRPPVVSTVPTYAERTKLVSSLAVGGGDGSEGNPWTLMEATTGAAAVAGDKVGIKNDGVYVGVNPGVAANNLHFTPTFRAGNSGTAVNKIWFIGEDGCEIRSGATVQASGWPAFGVLTKDYVGFANILSDNNDTNNKMASDSAPCTLWTGTGLEVHQCRFIGQTGQSDNYSGVRLENAISPEVADNEISGFTSNTNNSGVIIYKTQSASIHNNTIYGCNHGIQPKGAVAGVSEIWGLSIYENLIHDCTHAFRFHGPVKGPTGELSLVYGNIGYNLSYIAEFTSSNTHASEQNGLKIFNNTFNNVTSSDPAILWLAHNYSQWNPVPRDNRFFNNIISIGGAYLGKYGDGRTESVDTGSPPNAPFGALYNAQYMADFIQADRNVLHTITQFMNGASVGNLDSETLTTWRAVGQDVNSITTDPLFDAGTNVYTLQGGSPAIALGRDELGTFGTINATIPAGAYVTGSETIGVR